MQMKTIKKTVALFLSAVILLTALCVPTFAAPEKDSAVRFAVASDVHLRLPDEELPVEYPESELYYSSWESGSQTHEAAGLLLQTLARAKEQGAQFVLLCGDLAHRGNETQHRYFSALLRGFEEESGIPVYVVPGNHDYYNSTPAEFKAYYDDFGYSEALAVDTETASYTVNLPGDYRLIAIDSNQPGKGGDGLDERLFSWIDVQAKSAAADGKTPIAMMHHPLLDPIPYAALLMKDFIVRDHEKVAERFAGWGISYVFTGHEHGNNITSFTGSNGRVVYDILTTSLSSYPMEFRMVDLSEEKMTVSMERIEALDPAYIPPGYNDAQRAAIAADYTAYSLGFFKFSVAKKIEGVVEADSIKRRLDVSSGPLADAVDIVMPLVIQALNMPLYGGEGDSVAALAAAAGATLPPSNYQSLMDLITSIVAIIYCGGESIPTEKSPEGKILIVALNTLLKYILAQTGNQVTKQSLNRIFGALGLDQLDQIDLFRWNRMYVLGADFSYAAAESLLSPFLNKFLADDSIPDRDAVLPSRLEERPAGIAAFIESLKAVFGVFRNCLQKWTSFGKYTAAE